MQIVGSGTETYLYINGLSTSKEVVLHENLSLLPVTTYFHYGRALELLKNDVDFAVAVVSGRTIASQMRINAVGEKQLVRVAWNAAWDCILLGAIFHCEVALQSACCGCRQ